MITPNAISQIKQLKPGRQYAIVFERQLSVAEIESLKTQIDANRLHIKGLIISGARVVDLAQTAIVIHENQITFPDKQEKVGE